MSFLGRLPGEYDRVAMDPATMAIVLGGTAGAGAVAGAVRGKQGTPEQRVDTTQNQTNTQQTTFAPATEQERQLQQQSMQQYLAQLGLIDQYGQSAAQADPLRQAALGASQGIIGGQAFALSPDELARIQASRSALIEQGAADVNRYTDERLRQVVSGAAGRGLRGQALGALQGQVIDTGAQQLGNITRDANRVAAEQALQLPQQRIAAQSPFIQQGLTLADALRANAVEMRQLAQNPYMLSLLNNERLRSGTTTSSTSGGSTQITPARPGNWTNAFIGGLTGGLSGATAGANVIGGINGINAGTNMTTPTPAPSGQLNSIVSPAQGSTMLGYNPGYGLGDIRYGI